MPTLGHAGMRTRSTCPQVLVIIYEAASAIEWIPYLASIFAPLVPVWIMGRAAAERPACPRQESLWWGWRDCVLPYIQGLRVPQDTLFIVAEADWCMAPEHESVLCDYVDDLKARFVWCPPAPDRRRQSDQPDTEGAGSASSAAPKAAAANPRTRKRGKTQQYDPRADNPSTAAQPPRLWQWWYPERLRRPPVKEGVVQDSSPMLCDLVYFCNVAGYHGVGDLVWLSYDNYRWGRKGTPGNGSTAIAITKHGASQLLPFMTLSDQPGHIDLKLGEVLFTVEHDEWECVRILKECSSYAWHAFGGYHAHISGCDRKASYRTCRWKAPMQPYTRQLPERPAGDAKHHRWLVRCASRGAPQEHRIAEVVTLRRTREGLWLTYYDEDVMTDGAPDPVKCAAVVLAEIENRRRQRRPSEPPGPPDVAQAPLAPNGQPCNIVCSSPFRCVA